MKNPRIVCIKVGYSNAVLIVNGKNSVLVDTGVKNNLTRFKILFRENRLVPEDIKLIVLTHTHHDHTGNLINLVKLTGAKVLVHKNEFENLKNGFTPVPKGIGMKTRTISKLGKILWPGFASPQSFVADLVNEDEFNLAPCELDAKVISTPGHTAGSQSVIINKQLIAGDTFINLKNGTKFPHFLTDEKVLLKTWQQLFELKPELIFPGHGKPFRPEMAFSDFEKWNERLSRTDEK